MNKPERHKTVLKHRLARNLKDHGAVLSHKIVKPLAFPHTTRLDHSSTVAKITEDQRLELESKEPDS